MSDSFHIDSFRRLSEVAKVVLGQSPDSRTYNDQGEGLPFLQGNAEFGIRRPTPRLHCTAPNRVCEEGDILLSVRAPVGATNQADRRYAIGRGLAAIRLSDIDRAYGWHALRHAVLGLDLLAQGSTFTAVSRKNIEELPIWFPDGDARPAIALILDMLERSIEQSEALLAKQQRIKTGLLHDLLTRGLDAQGRLRDAATHRFKVTSLGQIPEEWAVEPLGEVGLIIDPNPSHRYPAQSYEGVPIISTENFSGEDDFDLSTATTVSRDVFDVQHARCRFQPDDVVFARKGRMGFARPYGVDDKVFSHTIVIIKSKGRRLQNAFLLWLLRSSGFFNELDLQMNSNSGVPTLGIRFIQSLRVRVPLLTEQAEIASVLNENSKALSVLTAERGKLRALRRGLMADLLTGRVPITPLLPNLNFDPTR